MRQLGHLLHNAVLVAAVLAIIAGACAGGTGTDDQAQANEARVSSTEWDEAFNSANLRALVALYADDAVSMPYDRPAISGKHAIEADLAAFFADFDSTHHTTIVGLEIAGDWAIERGDYTLQAQAKDGSESFSEKGKHIVVRRKTDDGWRVVWEIWNLNEPLE